MAANATTITREQERNLIARAKQGDRVSLRELVDGHRDRLYGFIFRMVRNPHDAEDICQDAFLKAFASLDSFSSEYRFSTWLFTIGYRVCLNNLRRKKPVSGELDFRSLPGDDAGDSNDILESEDAAKARVMVWRAVDRLSPPQRATVLLFYKQELGCQEIARVLQIPPATVKSHLHRARGRLRELLEPLTEHAWEHFRNFAERAG